MQIAYLKEKGIIGGYVVTQKIAFGSSPARNTGLTVRIGFTKSSSALGSWSRCVNTWVKRKRSLGETLTLPVNKVLKKMQKEK